MADQSEQNRDGTITFAVPMDQDQIDAFRMGWELAKRKEIEKVELKARGIFGNSVTVAFERSGETDTKYF